MCDHDWQWSHPTLLQLPLAMPPIRQTQYTAYSNGHTDNLFQLAQIHGGRLSHNTMRPQPYTQWIPMAHVNLPWQNLTLPTNLLQKISQVQGAAVNKMTQAKDASRLCEFLTFCQGLGIQSNNALPAREDILMVWASSYAGQLWSGPSSHCYFCTTEMAHVKIIQFLIPLAKTLLLSSRVVWVDWLEQLA